MSSFRPSSEGKRGGVGAGRSRQEQLEVSQTAADVLAAAVSSLPEQAATL